MRRGGLFLTIGDSTTYNTVSREQGMFLYSQIIARKIRETYGPIQHVNLGQSGSYSGDLVGDGATRTGNWQITGGFLEPDLVTIGYGMNDPVYGNGPTSPQIFTDNLTKIVQRFRLQNPNVHIIFCTPNSISSGAGGFGQTESGLVPYRTAMVELAGTLNVDVALFETAWAGNSEGTAAVTADGLHPNKAGHILLADILWPVVQTGAWLAERYGG